MSIIDEYARDALPVDERRIGSYIAIVTATDDIINRVCAVDHVILVPPSPRLSIDLVSPSPRLRRSRPVVFAIDHSLIVVRHRHDRLAW